MSGYVQLRNPVTKLWTRVNLRTGRVVGRRARPYKCPRRAFKTSPEVTRFWPSNHHYAKGLTLASGERVAIDALILPAVRKLNRLGYVTDFSCQGDQTKADHQYVKVVHGGYLSLAKGSFPQSLIDAATKAGFKITPRYFSASQDVVGPGSRDAEARARWVCTANRRFVRVLQRWAQSK